MRDFNVGDAAADRDRADMDSRRNKRSASIPGGDLTIGGGLGRACAHGAADLTDREAATAWGRGRPCTHHGNGSVGKRLD